MMKQKRDGDQKCEREMCDIETIYMENKSRRERQRDERNVKEHRFNKTLREKEGEGYQHPDLCL